MCIYLYIYIYIYISLSLSIYIYIYNIYIYATIKIYLLSTKTRGKQYIGNTTDNFRSRWNNYKTDVRKVENGLSRFLYSFIIMFDSPSARVLYS